MSQDLGGAYPEEENAYSYTKKEDPDMRNLYAKCFLGVMFLAFFSVWFSNFLYRGGIRNRIERQTIEDAQYRRLFYSEQMWEQQENLSKMCRSFFNRVREDSKYFPVPESTMDDSLTVSYVDSWMGERYYKEAGVHEGTDLMAGVNERGLYPVISISDGTVTNLGWLEKGGYRVGITSPHGVYFYYAHLESYADIQKGDEIRAGQLLGFMGDSGYGEEGTFGKFDVHLHLGVYSWDTGKEISVNPYYLLCELESKKLKYAYS